MKCNVSLSFEFWQNIETQLVYQGKNVTQQYHLSVDLWTIGISSVSRMKYFETLKGLEFNKCILF